LGKDEPGVALVGKKNLGRGEKQLFLLGGNLNRTTLPYAGNERIASWASRRNGVVISSMFKVALSFLGKVQNEMASGGGRTER